MNQNAEAIIILCSHLCVVDGVKPLEPREWSRLAEWLLAQKLEPKDLLEFSREDLYSKLGYSPEQADRFLRLVGRSASLGFEISRYESMGIQMVTRADAGYPKRLKHKLGNACPPLFYYAGELDLLNEPCAGYAGSRSIGPEALEFTRQAVRKTMERGYGVVSGGADGVDLASETEALLLGGNAVVYLAKPLIQRIKKRDVLEAIQDGRLLLMSAMKPDAGFQRGAAMARNKLIYCQSAGTVVVRSDLNKGGTWAGATECLNHQWAPVFCWRNPSYPGNMALIEKGAVPIDGGWDGEIQLAPPKPSEAPEPELTGEQISFFDN